MSVTEELKLLIRAETKQAIDGIKKTSGAVSGLGKATKKTGADTGSATSEMTSKWAKAAAGITAAVFSVKKALDFGKAYADFRQAADATQIQFGVSADKIIKKLGAVSAGTISNKDIVLAANRTMALNVTKDLDKMSTLLDFARLRAKAMGIGATQAFSDLTTGIGRNSPLILDNLGIITKGWAEHAKAAGQSYDAQFILNRVLAQAGTELRNAGKQTKTAAELFQTFSATLENVKVSIGQKLLPVISPFLRGLSNLLKIFLELPSSIQSVAAALGVLGPAVGGLFIALGPLGLKIAAVGLALTAVVSVIGKVSKEMEKGKESFEAFTQVLEDSVPIIGWVFKNLLDGIYDVIEAYGKLNKAQNDALTVNNKEVLSVSAKIKNNKRLIEIYKKYVDQYGRGTKEGNAYIRMLNRERKELAENEKQMKKLQVATFGRPTKPKPKPKAPKDDEVLKAARAEARLKIAIEKEALAQIEAERNQFEVKTRQDADRAVELTEREANHKINIVRAQLKAELSDRKKSRKEREAIAIEAETAIFEIEADAQVKSVDLLKKAEAAEEKSKKKRLANERAFWDAVQNLAAQGVQATTQVISTLNNNRILELENQKEKYKELEEAAAEGAIEELERRFDIEQELIEKQIDAEIEAEREKNSELLAIEEEYLRDKQALEEEDLELKIERAQIELADKQLQREYDLNEDERQKLELELREMEHNLRRLQNQLFYEQNIEAQKAASDGKIVELESSKDDKLTTLEKKKAEDLAKIDAKKNEKLENNQKKLDAQIKQINKENFETNRIAKLSEIAFRTAGAIMGIWDKFAWNPPIAGLLTGGAAAVSGTQIAAVAAEKNPYSFESGGLVTQDMTMVRMGEGNKREFVLNNRLTEMFLNIANSLRGGQFGNSFNGPINVQASDAQQFVRSVDAFRSRGNRFGDRF